MFLYEQITKNRSTTKNRKSDTELSNEFWKINSIDTRHITPAARDVQYA